jgi:hypothetical protein
MILSNRENWLLPTIKSRIPTGVFQDNRMFEIFAHERDDTVSNVCDTMVRKRPSGTTVV